MDFYEDTERTPGSRVGMRWWDQAGLDLAGEREMAATEADGNGMKSKMGKIGRLLGWDRGREYNIANLTNKVQSQLYLYPLCRVCNTTSLLCARHQ